MDEIAVCVQEINGQRLRFEYEKDSLYRHVQRRFAFVKSNVWIQLIKRTK